MIEAIQRHPKRALVVIYFLIFIVIVIAISNLVQTFFRINIINIVNSDEVQQILIFGISLDNWCTLLTMFGVVIGAGWGLIQYDRNTKLRQQEKATIIAQSFSDKLTLKCMLICSVIENSPLGQLLELQDKDCFSFNNFNTAEIRQVYNDDNFPEKYNNIKEMSNLDVIYYNILESRISTTPLLDIVKKHTKYNTIQARKLFILDNEGLPFSFDYLISSVLNELEYLCMSLASQAAGSTFVYQSLHQVFLRTIRVLAVEIAISNNNYYSDKYYTNIIEVYNIWKSLYLKSLNSEKKIKKKIDKILNPKIKKV